MVSLGRPSAKRWFRRATRPDGGVRGSGSGAGVRGHGLRHSAPLSRQKAMRTEGGSGSVRPAPSLLGGALGELRAARSFGEQLARLRRDRAPHPPPRSSHRAPLWLPRRLRGALRVPCVCCRPPAPGALELSRCQPASPEREPRSHHDAHRGGAICPAGLSRCHPSLLRIDSDERELPLLHRPHAALLCRGLGLAARGVHALASSCVSGGEPRLARVARVSPGAGACTPGTAAQRNGRGPASLHMGHPLRTCARALAPRSRLTDSGRAAVRCRSRSRR